jgi:hypothetical protein
MYVLKKYSIFALNGNISIAYFDAENCHHFEYLAGTSKRRLSSWQLVVSLSNSLCFFPIFPKLLLQDFKEMLNVICKNTTQR